LLQNPVLQNPVEDYPEIHKHFTRYSKGEFTGPIMKIRFTTNKITLNGSFEYEDFIQEYVASVMPDDEIDVTFNILSGADLKVIFSKLSLDWQLKKSTGKTKNFKGIFQGKFKKSKYLEILKELNKYSYYFTNFNNQQGFSVKCKTKPPQPPKKKPTNQEIEKIVKFCRGVVKNSKNNQKTLIKTLIPDFDEKIPDNVTKIKIINEYKINNIIIPKNIKSSGLLRIKSIRKGKLVRTIEIDNETEYTNTLNISV